jgi:signal transduction histidine kinase
MPFYDELKTDKVKALESIESNKLLANYKTKEEIAQLATQLSHDIQSPISALTTSLLKEGEWSESRKNLAINAMNRIKNITEDLLKKYRSQKHVELPVEEQELLQLISTVIEEKKLNLPTNIDLSFSHHLHENIVMNCKKGSELQRIISNLLNNSIDAIQSKTNSKIQLDLRQIGLHQIQIVITDNGCGIPPHILKEIGQRGFSYGKSNGNGLGLFHAKDIMKAWNGSFDIQSQENKGTIISLRFSA